MNAIHLSCPHCAARLRLRDQSFIGRTVHCPDCTEPVTIVRNAAGVIEALRAAAVPSESPDEPPSITVSSDPSSARPAASTRPGRTDRWRSPRLTRGHIAWLVAALVVLAPLGVLLVIKDDRAIVAKNPAPVPPLGAEAPAPPVAPPPRPAALDPTEPAAQDAPRGMLTLAEWAEAYREKHGVYPTENPVAARQPADNRLGWIAGVVADRDPAAGQPLWDRPLDDPLNSRFVRRRQLDLLNPLTPETSAHRFPATHFVGIAGVGADAATLPKEHPRAGIFGENRRTRADDVRDGLANTLLIAGVSLRPAPWAAGGTATLRSLTTEPYINGPDGLGTGQADGMFVAFADGSIRFLSRDTSPVILRRMAAMADGLPLDASVPGEPGDSRPVPALADGVPPPMPMPPGDVAQAGPMTPEDRPILPAVAADAPVVRRPNFDIETALSQPIARFSQVRPVKAVELLQQLEELAGIPITVEEVAAGPSASRLQREVSVELSQTTVRDILTTVLARADLTFETGSEFGVRVVIPDR